MVGPGFIFLCRWQVKAPIRLHEWALGWVFSGNIYHLALFVCCGSWIGLNNKTILQEKVLSDLCTQSETTQIILCINTFWSEHLLSIKRLAFLGGIRTYRENWCAIWGFDEDTCPKVHCKNYLLLWNGICPNFGHFTLILRKKASEMHKGR